MEGKIYSDILGIFELFLVVESNNDGTLDEEFHMSNNSVSEMYDVFNNVSA